VGNKTAADADGDRLAMLNSGSVTMQFSHAKQKDKLKNQLPQRKRRLREMQQEP
jgi:hypothetical protein